MGTKRHQVHTHTYTYITFLVQITSTQTHTHKEAYSEYIWLTAMNIWASGSTADFEAAWTSLETYLIPSEEDQPTSAAYDPSKPAAYAPEENTPSDYPVQVDRNVQSGQDDLNDELAAVYGSGGKLSRFYATHWLLDVDNIYGFGKHESGSASDRNVFINTFQRGANESVWRTVPNPEWEAFKYGGVTYPTSTYTHNRNMQYIELWLYANLTLRSRICLR